MSLIAAGLVARLRAAWPLAFGAALAALALVLAVVGAARLAQPIVQPAVGLAAGEILPGAPLGQTFTARWPRVYRVDVMLATYARQNSGPLIFHLKRSPEAVEDLATVTIDAATVQDNALRTFTFAPVANEPGETLFFSLEAPAATPGNSLTAWGSPTNAYDGGRAVLAAPLDVGVQDLTFRVYAAPTLAQTLALLPPRLTGSKPGVFGTLGWYIALGLAYLALLVWLGWLVASERTAGP